MITKLQAYTSLPEVPTLILSDPGRIETDFIQIRNIDGLDPVQASVNLSSLALIDGETYVGSNVPSRNIVLTLHPNPDYTTWAFETLRQLIYTYFMPKASVLLVFHSDEVGVVQIPGTVESVVANPFSQDPEYLVSIICPDPFFTSVDPVELTGSAIRSDGTFTDIDVGGNVETWMDIKLTYVSGTSPTYIRIQLGNPATSYFQVLASVSLSKYFSLRSRPRSKYVRNVNKFSGVITNRLGDVQDGSKWPVFLPSDNKFGVITDVGVQTWKLTYYKRFGGI